MYSRIRRAGIIPYTWCNGKLLFLFGVDSGTMEFTDFGGGVKMNESWEQGAIREYKEELGSHIPSLTTDVDLEKATYISNNKMRIYFLPVNSIFYKNFISGGGGKANREILEVNWIESVVVQKNINIFKGPIWPRIVRFFRSNISDFPKFRTKLQNNYLL